MTLKKNKFDLIIEQRGLRDQTKAIKKIQIRKASIYIRYSPKGGKKKTRTQLKK